MIYPNLELLEYKSKIIFLQVYEKSRGNPIKCKSYVFPQTWGSTALGFSGVGGSAMTDAYTTVVEVKDYELGIYYYFIYFDSKIAYSVEDPSKEFFEDLKNMKMASVLESKERY